jgi:molybdopterin-guanine dinucleotide biosynthesis protein A
LRSVREKPPGGGPLAALLAGVDALATPQPVIGLACDLPNVSAAALRLLAEWPGDHSVVPVVDGRAQYACARWSRAAIVAARAAFLAGERALAAVAAVDAELVSDLVAASLLADVDTPDDLRRLGLS